MFADLSMPWRAVAIADVVVVVVLVWLNLRYVLPPILRYLRETLTTEDGQRLERAQLDTVVRLSDRKEQSL
jgi:hypothetical protein